MPAATPPSTSRTSKNEREELLLEALKQHIMRERQKKKEEQEAEIEEERIRKEKEARDRQDAMTLGETREQIQKLKATIDELRNEKQQLFLKLKKVLNEDDNRKKQQALKENEFFIQLSEPSMPGNSFIVSHQRLHHGSKLTASQGTSSSGSGPSPGTLKRGRSPSPTMQPAPNSAYFKTVQPYAQPPTKHDDGRRGNEVGRAVLWNKAQYPSIFYGNQQQPQLQQPQAPAPQESRGAPVLFAQKYRNFSTPIGFQEFYLPAHKAPSQIIVGDTDKQRPEIYLTMDPNSAAQQPQQQPPQPQSHKPSPHQFERNKTYHIDSIHEDRKRMTPEQQATILSQPNADAIIFQNVRNKMPMPPNSGIITQGYPSRGPPPPGQPPSSQAQTSMSQQQQNHFARMRY